MKRSLIYFLLAVVFILGVSLAAGRLSSLSGRLIDKLLDRHPDPVIVPKPEETIKILEGWTNLDIARYFERQGNWPSAEFLKETGSRQASPENNRKLSALKDWSKEFTFLADEENIDLEGYLFPDTYRIYASSTAAEVIKKMLDNFDGKLTAKMRTDIAKQGKSIREIIIMASIIEKEAPMDSQKDDKDARIISGIFWNRFNIGMKFDSDATLTYILGDTAAAHSIKDTKIDSPYNTYKYGGLPPGPICNPGILAIEAAIYPTQTKYFYFLTTTDGQVVYAKTNEEHSLNKAKYLR